MEKKDKYTNNLIHETSLYLLQHAHNPVNWYPWGEEALEKAKKENKPVFLSIGYAACHWCHVMERESFENEDIAEILNQNFVSIKVDREERPDLDEIYMAAVMALSGSGGWPMTVFLTPDLKPFVGGTYFPPEDKWGRIGFKRLITRIGELWKNEASREKLLSDAEKVTKVVEQRTSASAPVENGVMLDQNMLVDAVNSIEDLFDAQWGGFSSAPKFPPSNTISILLRDYHHRRNKKSLEMAALTLDKMYEGGLYDHLAGGFHRYSTDEKWLVPHFEKMLYDNAQLAVVYLEAYQLTGKKQYARVAQEIFDYVMIYMTDKAGGIYSTEDADSEGKEGVFYLWKQEELEEILGKEEEKIFSSYYNLKREGNFASHEPYHKGLNILHIRRELASVANELKMKEGELEKKLSFMREKLTEVRDRRIRPGLDDKIITSWNALMISAFARGFQVLQDERYLQAAEKTASFIIKNLRSKDGKLLRIYRKGKARYHAYLEDHAYLARAFIDLYEAGFDTRWLFAAEDLVEKMIDEFWDEKSASFFNTGKRHKNLIVRPKTTHDGAVPSPTAVTVEALLRMSKLLDKEDYFEKAQKILKANHSHMKAYPQAYLSLLSSVDFLVYPVKEIVIVGQKDSEDTQRLLRAIHGHFIPNRVITFMDTARSDKQELTQKIPLLAGRAPVEGKATVYVCENFACKLPVTDSEKLLEQLGIK